MINIKGHKKQDMHLNTIISWVLKQHGKKLQRHELMSNNLVNQVCYEFGCCKQLWLQQPRAVV